GSVRNAPTLRRSAIRDWQFAGLGIFCRMKFDPGYGRHWVPLVNIYVTIAGELRIEAELGPMKRTDLELTADGNRLRIAGHRPDDDSAIGCEYLLREVPSGRFERVIDVPAGYNLSGASAVYLTGRLRVVVPQVGPAPTEE